MREHGADAGIAHDGDADRCLAVDADGVLVDGDHILAILAMAMDRNGDLVESTVVATVMANLGFKNAMRTAGITVVETGVGDRYVLEAMRDGGFVLGGEQSGHVVMSSHATTGDGILTGLHLLAEVARSGQPLSELAGSVTKLPQVLINVRGVDRAGIAGSPTLAGGRCRGRGGARRQRTRAAAAVGHGAGHPRHGRGGDRGGCRADQRGAGRRGARRARDRLTRLQTTCWSARVSPAGHGHPGDVHDQGQRAAPHLDHSPNTAATAMFPEAGMVVTEMNTPTRPPDLADVSASTPAAPAMTATMSDHAFGRVDEGRAGPASPVRMSST